MTDLASSKADLRRQMRRLRDDIPLAQRVQRCEAIRRRVLALPQVADADSVFCYVSFGSEVDTHDLIRELLAMGKTVAVPRLTGPGTMLAQHIDRLDDLVPGLYGFLQPPPSAPLRDVKCDVTLVPGLAFTQAGDRLGYGAGHYDRYFADHHDTLPIGLCFHDQLVAHLPVQPFDHPMRIVTTERS